MTELARLASQAKPEDLAAHYPLAVIEAGLGNKEQAIAQLETVSSDGGSMVTVKLDPAFASLHSEPRFIALVRKIDSAP